jgi:hypothetical protein
MPRRRPDEERLFCFILLILFNFYSHFSKGKFPRDFFNK